MLADALIGPVVVAIALAGAVGSGWLCAKLHGARREVRRLEHLLQLLSRHR